MEARNNKISPNKHKLDHELLIHSLHAKPEKLEGVEQQKFKAESPNSKAGLWQMREEGKGSTNNGLHSPAFGGIINNYLNQYTHY